jgi:hypothetical protein
LAGTFWRNFWKFTVYRARCPFVEGAAVVVPAVRRLCAGKRPQVNPLGHLASCLSPLNYNFANRPFPGFRQSFNLYRLKPNPRRLKSNRRGLKYRLWGLCSAFRAVGGGTGHRRLPSIFEKPPGFKNYNHGGPVLCTVPWRNTGFLLHIETSCSSVQLRDLRGGFSPK